jgi:rare lipoprotein A
MMKSILFLITLLVCNVSFAGQIGTASWYGPGFHGKKTASGDRFNSRALTAAHKTIKLGTKVRVTNLHNNKSVIVLINDRGPFSRGRIIDLSSAAKSVLGMGGTAKVSVEILR